MSPVEPDLPATPRGFVDLPLRPDVGSDLFAPPPATGIPAAPSEQDDAPLSRRAIAFAADAAGTSLAVTIALIAAAAATGRSPSLAGAPWVAAFTLGYSFVFVALPLTLFGRTVGMSLAGLVARPGPAGHRLAPAEAAGRWAGTLLTAALIGLPLLLTARDPRRPTPADRLSGRPLAREFDI